MKANLYVKKSKDEENGYTNTYFRLQGVGLNGLIPIRVCYFGKPVMEPVMEKVVDLSGKPILKEGKEQFREKKDEEGNVIMQAKKDDKGKEILRDELFSERVEVLSMYSGDYENGIVCDPVDIIAKARSVAAENGEKFNYYAVCGNERVPIEVPDFSTADRPDYRYRGNCRKLASIAERI